MVLRNVLTDEHVVVQGSEYEVAACRSALDGLALDGKPGPWRPVRHFHTVDASGMTPMGNRYPSGIGGDMAGARGIALRTGKTQIEWIDIVTERGPEKVYFGYDPVAKRYLVSRPTAGGPGEFEYFSKLDEYHEWVERETGEPLEILGRGDEGARKAADPPAADDEPTLVDAQPQLSGVAPQHRAAALLARYPSAAEVRAATIRALSELGHGMDAADLPDRIVLLRRSLRRLPGDVNAEVLRLLPTVAGALRNPAVYAEVMVKAWEAVRANAQKYPDINRALLGMAPKQGRRVVYIPRDYGTENENFFKEYAGTHDPFVDLPFFGMRHGALTHLVMDQVVDLAFLIENEPMTSGDFRAMLSRCTGFVDQDSFAIVPEGTENAVPVGQAVWEVTYDLLTTGELNVPEDLAPKLAALFGLK
jgi:hypothetical protein